MNLLQAQESDQNFNDQILDIIAAQNGENVKFLDNIVNPEMGKFVIIASFTSKRQVLFASQKLIRKSKELKIHATYQTLKRNMDTEWSCIRFHETIIHLFQVDVRDYYKIDKFYLCEDEEDLRSED
jgi:ribosomal silencing factor RsfS